ncbi:MAG: L-histidine N(alpha)-methyltransferase [Deltaproteobacteria bacterium]
MQHAESALFFAPEQQQFWRMSEASIWSIADNGHREDAALSIMRTLWDQPRWLEAYHLYDDRGSELFEKICELPEYYLTRTENALIEQVAAQIIAAAPVRCVVELGAGSAKKTTHLLSEQARQRGAGIFAPIDVSLPGLLASREYVRAQLAAIEFHGLHARYEDGICGIHKNLPKLFIFIGSTIGNFNPAAFVRFFSLLSQAMGPNDFLLIGADRVKDRRVLESAYADSQGLTAEFILNVFKNINRLTSSNFDLSKMRYHSWYNPEWAQIEMYAVATSAQEINFPAFGKSFHWHKNGKILVEISRKFDPTRLQEQLSFFGLSPVKDFTDPKEWFSLLLFKKDG